MLNINVGKNRGLMDSCRPLAEYAWLVGQVRKNNKARDEEGAGSAIDRAITDMPADFVIKPFLEAHKVEVKGMLLTEYNEAEQMELFKEDGRKEGRIEGIFETLINLVKDNSISIKKAALQAGVSEDVFRQKLEAK